jgi:hypothetical protein
MHARVLTLKTAAATRRWRQHPRRLPRAAGRLDSLSREVLSRFLDEGVPESKVLYVAAETLRCVREIEAGNELPVELDPWTWEILSRYSDKAATLFMTVGGGRMVRV